MQNALRDEENSTRFLDDPAETIKLFLSSYTRDKGYLYAEPNLFNLPHLATYFISFLIRSRVLPEIERELKSALAVSHLAERELPATGRVGKLLPDPFGRGCVDLWGTKGTGYQRAGVVWGEEEIPKVEEKKVDGGLVEEAEDGWKKVDVVEPVLEAEAGGWGWGSNADTGGWGSGGASTGGWGQPADEASAQWTLSDPTTTLLAILGPTALPLTHTPGIIENSMRRIISFSPPPPVGSVGKSPVVADPDAEAVEAELERMFGKIVLGPWVGWNVRDEFEHITVPSVAKGSRGAFVDSSSPPSSDATQEATGLKPHDPLKDNITILIAPETYKTLDPIEGLGIAGTFVQLARIVDLEGGVVKKKKGKKGKGREERFWYVDDTTLNIPSFWKQVPKVKKEGKGKKGKGKKVEED
ncbi:hypothetical protein BDQ17DRAFT_684327 [Cyathus striatus]|nr:hypothetical protein BDQ17DRAFT_684327 [Cyathus striatus]